MISNGSTIFLSSLKKIEGIGTFLFENDESSSIESLTIPTYDRSIIIELTEIKIGSYSMLLRGIRKTNKNFTQNFVYDLYRLQSVKEINAFLTRSNILLNDIISFQEIEIRVKNYDELLEHNFSPEHLDNIISKKKSKIEEQIYKIILKPFGLMLTGIIRNLEHEKSLKEARSIIENITGVLNKAPNSRKSKAKNFIQLDEYDINTFIRFYHVLRELQLINRKTTEEDWIDLTLEKDKSKIIWDGKPSELRWLIDFFSEKYLTKIHTNLWATYANLFIIDTNKNLAKSLESATGKKPLGYKKIENILKVQSPEFLGS